jgi:crotonobetaine/carnitine-CoA ligase
LASDTADQRGENQRLFSLLPYALVEDLVSPRLLRGSGPDLGPLATRFAPDAQTMLHVLDAQAEARPDATWLTFDGLATLTFERAREQVRRVANALEDTVERGVRGATIALLLRNQVEFMPAFMGAQAAGGVAAPLNPELRGPLLAKMLGQCAARVLVTRADLLPRLQELESLADVELVLSCGAEPAPPDSVHGVPVRDFDAWCASASSAAPERLPAPWELGALVFTSGTSGGSKAAMWPHRYIYLSSATAADALGHKPSDVLSTPLQMCHIAGLQVFANAALHVGCSAHLKSYFSASSWWREIAEDGATFAMLMGQMAAMILRQTPSAPPHRLDRVYILPQPRERELFERRYGTVVIWQGWGMTEIFPHPPAREPLRGVPDDTIGCPPAWVDFGVVDEHDRMLRPHQRGELVYRPLLPDAMARGYFRDPDATARAFRNFVFHTGDIGYYDEQQRIHFVMRNADAIRRRGENISAVELENVALSHPDVTDAAAYGVPAEMGEHEVKLDVVAATPLSLPELFDWLVERLPRFMVPRYLEQREQLPKTVSQRVEKYKLLAEGIERPAVQAFEPPARRRLVA